MAEGRSSFACPAGCQSGVNSDPNFGANGVVTVTSGDDDCEYNDNMIFTEIRRLYSESSGGNGSFVVPDSVHLREGPRTHDNKIEAERSCRGFRAKLDGFLVKCKDFVFRSLDTTEAPKLESRADEIRNEGSYVVGPSIDLYFGFDVPERIRQFYRAVRAGDIIIGQVSSAAQSGINIKFLCFDGTKRGFLEDLEIVGICTQDNIIFKLAADPAIPYEVNDKVRCEVLDISYTTRQVTVGMKGLKVSHDVLNLFPLGGIQDSELPLQYVYSKARLKSKKQTTYEQTISDTMAINNPSFVTLSSALGIYGNDLSFMTGLRNRFPQNSMITAIRDEQNKKVVETSLKQGFEFSRAGNTDQALISFSKALVLDPNNLDGLVARGIIYSTRLMVEQAKQDLEAAIKLNPTESVQKKKIGSALLRTGMGFQNQNDLESALSCYVSCVDVLSGVANTLTTFMDVHEQVGRISDKLHGLLLAKASELCDKLRTLIAEEHLNKDTFGCSPISNPSPLEEGEVVSSSPTVQLSVPSDDLSPVSIAESDLVTSESKQINSCPTHDSGNTKDDGRKDTYRKSPTRSRTESRCGTRSRTRCSKTKSRSRSNSRSPLVRSISSSVETKRKRKEGSSARKAKRRGGVREPGTSSSGSEDVRSRRRTKVKSVSVEDQVSAFLENIEERALSGLVPSINVTVERNLPRAKAVPDHKVELAYRQEDSSRGRPNTMSNRAAKTGNSSSSSAAHRMGVRFGIRKKPKIPEDINPVIFSSPSSSSASESSPILLRKPKWIPIPEAPDGDDEEKDQGVKNSSRATSDDDSDSPSLRRCPPYLQSRDFSCMESVEDYKLEAREGELRASSTISSINDPVSSYLPSLLVGNTNIPRFSERRVPASWNLDLLQHVCKSPPRVERKSYNETEVSTRLSPNPSRRFEQSHTRTVGREFTSVTTLRSSLSPVSQRCSRPSSPRGLEAICGPTSFELASVYRGRSSSKGHEGQKLQSSSDSSSGTPKVSSSSRPRSQSRSRPRSQGRSLPRSHSRSRPRSHSRSRPRSQSKSRPRSHSRSRPRSHSRSRPRSQSRSSPRSRSRSRISEHTSVRRRRSPSGGDTSSKYELSHSSIRGYNPNYVSPHYLGRNPIPASKLERMRRGQL